MLRRMIERIVRALGFDGRSEKKRLKKELRKIIGFEINYKKNDFLLQGLDFLLRVKEKGARFSQRNNRFMVTIDNLNFQINSWEELFILNEVFVEKVYTTELPQKFALIDIGMNVGIASLYFASQAGCERVFAYEPFTQTVEKAKENLALNPQFADKISIFQIGLGFPERAVQVYYSEKFKGSVGMYEDAIANQSTDKELRELEVKDVSEWLKKNFDGYTGNFVAKIDCEGAEYEIIKRLDETLSLQNISSFMIEWHGAGPGKLKAILLKNNYEVEEKASEHSYRGMIYSKKKS